MRVRCFVACTSGVKWAVTGMLTSINAGKRSINQGCFHQIEPSAETNMMGNDKPISTRIGQTFAVAFRPQRGQALGLRSDAAHFAHKENEFVPQLGQAYTAA